LASIYSFFKITIIFKTSALFFLFAFYNSHHRYFFTLNKKKKQFLCSIFVFFPKKVNVIFFQMTASSGYPPSTFPKLQLSFHVLDYKHSLSVCCSYITIFIMLNYNNLKIIFLSSSCLSRLKRKKIFRLYWSIVFFQLCWEDRFDFNCITSFFKPNITLEAIAGWISPYLAVCLMLAIVFENAFILIRNLGHF